MTIERFGHLNDIEKEELVWDKGVFLINYEAEQDICDVYELFEFYVAFCYQLNRNEKAQIIAKTNADELPHLQRISL